MNFFGRITKKKNTKKGTTVQTITENIIHHNISKSMPKGHSYNSSYQGGHCLKYSQSPRKEKEERPETATSEGMFFYLPTWVVGTSTTWTQIKAFKIYCYSYKTNPSMGHLEVSSTLLYTWKFWKM